MDLIRFDRRIIIISNDNFTKNKTGELIYSSVTYTTLWAKLWKNSINNKGMESNSNEANQLEAVKEDSFIIRWRGDLNEEMNIIFDRSIYNIKSINEFGKERKKYLIIKAIWKDNYSMPSTIINICNTLGSSIYANAHRSIYDMGDCPISEFN